MYNVYVKNNDINTCEQKCKMKKTVDIKPVMVQSNDTVSIAFGLTKLIEYDSTKKNHK